MAYDSEDTVDLDPLTETTTGPAASDACVDGDLEIGAATHVGKVRVANEDHYAVVRRTRIGELLSTSLGDPNLEACTPQRAWLMAVADGLGGHVSGEVASSTAINAILNFACKLSSWVMQPITDVTDDSTERVELYSQAIQNELQKRVRANPELEGMATTVTAAYVFGSTAYIANVGDSRSYLVRNDSLSQITKDHSMAKDLEDAGAPASVVGRYQNILTRTFNTRSERVLFDLWRLDLAPKDQILLCSDGLTDMVSDDEIQKIVSAGLPTQDACDQLIDTALKNGGRDNITVVLCRI